MRKIKQEFVCLQCQHVQAQWSGQCPSCNSWGQIEARDRDTHKKSTLLMQTDELLPLQPLASGIDRQPTHISEFDRCLGGGLVQGSVVLISGPPGIGKSTLLTQLAGHLAANEQVIAYVCGEESAEQVAGRVHRLQLPPTDHIRATTCTDVDKLVSIMKAAQPKPQFMIVDSMQTLFSTELSGPPGSINQVRGCVHELVQWTKKHNITLILVGHVTKDNQLAGPRVVEHLVDVVLQFEGDGSHQFRILRATKNRFGNTAEIGVFDMTINGLKSVENPSAHLLSGRSNHIAGSVVFSSLEGTRPILGEIQALTTPTGYATPKRSAVGFDNHRLGMLLAVIEARAGIDVSRHDVFVTVMGGLKVSDTSLDLAIVVAILSALHDIALPSDYMAIGELGLTGEVRAVRQLSERLDEARRLGYQRGIIPHSGLEFPSKEGYKQIAHVNAIYHLIEQLMNAEGV